ncbi:MAG: hypothetical protein ACKOW9_00345 [Candidatus Paceibacterota bacterium]
MRNFTLNIASITGVFLLATASITPAQAETVTPPTSVVATSKPAAISITFKVAAGVSNYEIRCTSASGKTTQVSKSTADSNQQEVLLTRLTDKEPYACSARSVLNSQYSPWVSANPGILSPTPLALPGSPGKINVQPLVGALKLVFNSASNAAEYQVTCATKDNDPVTVKQPHVNQSTQEVLVTLPIKPYACNVTALNNAGSSKPVIAPTVTPLTPNIQTPSNVTVIPSDQSAAITFTPVAEASYYVAYCASKTGKSVEISNVMSSPVTVTGLSNNSLYICSVRAVKKSVTATGEILDTSLWGSSQSFTPNPPKQIPPLAPRILSGSPSYEPSTQVSKVIFNITYDPNGGTPATYSVTCLGVTDPAFTSTAQSPSPVTLQLPPDKNYRCQATATNAFGTSAASQPVDIKTNPVVVAPSILTVKTTKKKDYTVDAVFNISPFPGASAYRVTCVSDEKTLWRPSSKTTATLNLTLGRWSCTTSAMVQGAMTPESAVKFISVTPPKPVLRKTSDTSVKMTRPVGWKSSWLATCRSDTATAARAGKTASITLDLPRGSYQCRAYLDGVPSDIVNIKL